MLSRQRLLHSRTSSRVLSYHHHHHSFFFLSLCPSLPLGLKRRVSSYTSVEDYAKTLLASSARPAGGLRVRPRGAQGRYRAAAAQDGRDPSARAPHDAPPHALHARWMGRVRGRMVPRASVLAPSRRRAWHSGRGRSQGCSRFPRAYTVRVLSSRLCRRAERGTGSCSLVASPSCGTRGKEISKVRFSTCTCLASPSPHPSLEGWHLLHVSRMRRCYTPLAGLHVIRP
jgi:hypothetical protein